MTARLLHAARRLWERQSFTNGGAYWLAMVRNGRAWAVKWWREK